VAAAWAAEKAGGSFAVRKKNPTCSNWEKRLRFHPNLASWNSTRFFNLPPLLSGDVRMYKPGWKIRVQSLRKSDRHISHGDYFCLVG
jgi:hypothetical protein